jgi:DNA primase large subunit
MAGFLINKGWSVEEIVEATKLDTETVRKIVEEK